MECRGAGVGTGLHVLLCSAANPLPRYRVVAPDLRGHGLTTTSDDVDFSKEVRSWVTLRMGLRRGGLVHHIARVQNKSLALHHSLLR